MTEANRLDGLLAKERFKYRREIDGLRALAVVPVIFYHAGVEWFTGGYVGVDVFLVISGYLITSLILSESAEGRFTLIGFYERRARRLLPALFVVLLSTVPFAWLLMYPAEYRDYSQSLISTAVFSSNFLFWLESGYFAPAAELKPLLHTWSLAVEEQFYLVFPLLLLALLSWSRKSVVILFSLIGGVSLLAAEWMSGFFPAANFYLLPTRAWELLTGALIGLFATRAWENGGGAGSSMAQALSVIGLALILVAVVTYDEATPFPGIYTLLPVFGTSLVIVFAGPSTLVGRLLSLRLVVQVGLLSYSAYLWHFPIFALAKLHNGGPLDAVDVLKFTLATVALSALTYAFVENPIRRKSVLKKRWVFFSCTFAVSVGVFAIGAAGHLTDGFRDHFVDHRLTQDQREMYSLVTQYTQGDTVLLKDDGRCRFSTRDLELVALRFDRCYQEHGKAKILLGDSHAMNIFNALFEVDLGPFVVGVVQGGCRPHETRRENQCHYSAFEQFLKEHADEIEYVIYHQSGSHLLSDPRGVTDSDDIFTGEAPYRVAEEKLDGLTAYLVGLGQMTRVIWLGPFVEARVNLREIKTLVAEPRINPRAIEAFGHLESKLVERTRRFSDHFRYISLHGILQMQGDFLLQGSCLAFRDEDHLSSCGEQTVGERLRASRVFDAAVRPEESVDR